jgi:Ca2+-binding RTX toxin-like protein
VGNSAANVFAGGAGDDTYGVSTGDTVVEQADEGTDLVLSNVSWTLGANLEKLYLTGTGAIDGTGNGQNNTLIGNSAANVLTGGAGDDLFNGSDGTDTLIGGTGHDTYYASVGDTIVENANEGTDWVLSNVSWTLAPNLENLTLFGTGAIDGTGNSQNNIFVGNSAANVFAGGAGDDTYGVSVGDSVVEQADEGTDWVLSNVSFTVGSNIENLTLTENAANGTGNELNNTLMGNSGANVLTGGAGDDTYGVSTGDTVVEQANEGTDLVLSNVSWTLGANVEKLTLTGTAAIDGTGNELNNTLIGNSAANVLTGGAGNDTLAGGQGNDTYVVNPGDGQDTVAENDGTAGHTDQLLFGTGIDPIDLVLSRQATDLRIAVYGTADRVTIRDWYSAPTTAQVEALQAGDGQMLLNTQVEQLIQAMATFSQQTGLTWEQGIAQQPQEVQTILAASWQ